jgi:nitrogen fixation protein FixH
MQKPLTGKHVLIILLSAFAVVFAVNGYFLYAAISTLPGEQRGATYQAGLHYNDTLADERAQAALHWSHKSQIMPDSRVSVSVTDASGAPVAGLAIEGWLERPSSDKGDHKLAFKEVEAGRYEALDQTPDGGNWMLTFKAEKAQAGGSPAIYRARERLWVGPVVAGAAERLRGPVR